MGTARVVEMFSPRRRPPPPGQRACVMCTRLGSQKACGYRLQPRFAKVEVGSGVASFKEDDALFHFWFHASMLPRGRDRLVRRKWLLDGLKDPKHKRFDAQFCVILELQRGAGTAPSSGPGGELLPSVSGML